MQVKHHARARRPGGGQRPPAQRGLEVVGVDHPRAVAAHGGGNAVGVQPAAQQARGRAPSPQRRRGAGKQLRPLAEALAHQPNQVVHHALLAAGGAIAVVQEQHHPVRGSLVRQT